MVWGRWKLGRRGQMYFAHSPLTQARPARGLKLVILARNQELKSCVNTTLAQSQTIPFYVSTVIIYLTYKSGF